jgi:putative membrane protein
VRILLSIVANAVALFAAAQLVHGITFRGDWSQPETWLRLLVAGAIFGLLNLIVRPIALFLSLPFLVLTLGLFYFVLNGLLLWGFSKLMPGYDVAGLWAGILGSLVIMVVNWVVSALFGGKAKK